MIYFNGFTLLCCMVSAVLGAVIALRIAKVTRDYDRTALVWDSMVRDYGNPLDVHHD